MSTPNYDSRLYTLIIGAGTGPAGPAMAGPFSVKVETILRSGLVVRHR